MFMPTVTTPSAITQEILDFCRAIEPAHGPLWLELEPQGWAKPQNAFLNVGFQVSMHGGAVQHGWIIWLAEHTGRPLYAEAEFHAVWAAPNRALIDITPKADGERRVLFLPDSKMSFEGSVVPNRLHDIARTEISRTMVEGNRRIAEVTAALSDKVRNGELPMGVRVPVERIMLETIAAHGVRLGFGRNDLCPCLSGRTYKNCHRRITEPLPR
ncbi:MAG: hypothetical protein BGO49_19620 [Planctomycetales bacterium 71-10]|nr:MAG: hypothetical protein BGO49_19620 [Planctomycetales bacterium 71-10]